MVKLEKQGLALKKIEATQAILLDMMRSSENATRPEGWPNLRPSGMLFFARSSIRKYF